MAFPDEEDFERYFNLDQSDQHGSIDASPGISNGLPIPVNYTSPPGLPRYVLRCRLSYSSNVRSNPCPAELSNFSNYIPNYGKSQMPCDYCWSQQFDCFTSNDATTCTACHNLFRQCSLAPFDVHVSFLDDADALTIAPHVSDLSLGSSICDEQQTRLDATNQLLYPEGHGKAETNSARFPKATIRILKRWVEEHSGHPYPTTPEKDHLRQLTGLKDGQISTWLANARRRNKGKTEPKMVLLGDPSQPIDIPNTPAKDNLTPLERWRLSPPENEPALVSDIARAIANSDQGSATSSRPHSHLNFHGSSSSSKLSEHGTTSSFGPETRSSESGVSSSAISHGSRTSYGSFACKQRRRKYPAMSTRPVNTTIDRPFKCTFCTDSFQTKYDWTRHEKTLHLKIGKWLCSPIGPVIAATSTGDTQCVYCNVLNPSKEHIECHSHGTCEEKPREARTFYRKDHLRQHLRLVHEVTMTEHMETWKVTPSVMQSRCGFCVEDVRFKEWDARAEHLSRHFREGATMAQWRGSWGFDDEVEKMVENAIPPYMNAHESTTPMPFSASKNCLLNETTFNMAGTDDRATCWEVLTLHLGQHVRRQLELGLRVSDEELQREARLLVYGEDDPWNQTAADMPEWLTLFKQAHGLSWKACVRT